MIRTRVLKFGGTSLATPDLLRAAAAQIASIRAAGERVAVVVSAMGHATDALVTLAGQVAGPRPTPRELDALLATGEQVSAALMAMALRALGLDAASFCGPRIGITTDSRHGAGTIRHLEPTEILATLERGGVPVIAGFQGVDAHGDLVTLGRGGSDTTAVAIAAALRDHESPGSLARCEILTDVPGICTADPRAIPEAEPIAAISARAMLQLARVGAQVMHAPAVSLALAANVEILVREAHPSGTSAKGTCIEPAGNAADDPQTVGLLVDRARIRLEGHADPTAVLTKVQQELGRQATGSLVDHAAPGLIVAAGGNADAIELLREHAAGATVIEEPDLTVVSLVGAGSSRRAIALAVDEALATGWWDGEPATAWWLVPAAAAIPLARRLLATGNPARSQGDSGQRNGDYETLGSGEGASAGAAATAATMAP